MNQAADLGKAHLRVVHPTDDLVALVVLQQSSWPA